MKKTLFLFLSICLFLCGSQLSAQISASVTEGCAPLVGVQFDSPSNATGINWDFGDDASSNIFNPTHTYPFAGVYTVVYTATVGGNPVTEELTITVYGNPSPNFEADVTSGCAGTPITFTNLSVGGGGTDLVSCEWDFGGGIISTDCNPPPITYPFPGTFDVTLAITDANGCDSLLTLTDYITITEAPTAIITASSTSSCTAPLTVNFSASQSSGPNGEDLTYEWDFGNGATSTLETPNPIEYTTVGTYTVTLTVSIPNGCSISVTELVSINEPIAAFLTSGISNDTICSTTQFVNQSTPGGTYLWQFGDGNTSTAFNPTHTYEEPGTYDITLTVNVGSCTSDITQTVVVQEVISNFVSDPTYSCSVPYEIQFTDLSTNAISWEWEFGDGTTSTEQNPMISVDNTDDNPYTIYTPFYLTNILIVTSEYGCTDTLGIAFQDTLDRPTARFMPDTAQGCVPLEVRFIDLSISTQDIVSWYYDFGDGNTSTTTDDGEVSHTFTEAGTFEVILVITNSAGCMDTSYIQPIEVGNPPTPEFVLDTTQICPNQPVQFTDITPLSDSLDTWHYEGDGGLFSNCINDSMPTFTFTNQTGPQEITLTAGHNGCYGSTTIPNAINVNGPIGHITHDCSCSNPYNYEFTGNFQLADSWDWIFGDGDTLFNSTDPNPTHVYSESGDYWVKLISYKNDSVCAPFVDSLQLKVRNLTAEFTSDTLVCVGIPAVFDASASQDVNRACYKGYQWYFDDGKHPIWTQDSVYQYAFGSSGDHEVRLITEDINGCRDTTYQNVRAFRVEANFDAGPLTGCINPGPFTVDFTDLTTADTTLASWSWDFGDGIGMSEEQNPSYTYTQEPSGETFTALLQVMDVLGCPGNFTVSVTPSIPNAEFLATSSRFICEGESVSFAPVVNDHMSYTWDFGNSDNSSDQTPTSTFNETGSYDVALTVSDSLGCEKTFVLEDYVLVQPFPTADFFSSADELETVCWGELITFTNNSIASGDYTLSWDLGNDEPVVPNESVGTIYDAPGIYQVALMVTSSYGCTDTIQKTLEVEGPTADFTLDPDIICRGQDITFELINPVDVADYTWDFGDGTTEGAVPVVTHTYDISPGSGATFASLVYWSEDSVCTGKTTRPINFHNVIANFNRNGEVSLADTVHCAGIPDVFTNISVNADNAEWDFGDGTTFSGSNPPPHTYESPGEYIVTLSIEDNETGCTDVISKTMVISDKPAIDIADQGACEGDSVQLMASGGATYQWFPATGLSNPNIPNPIAAIDSTMEYSVIVTDEVGCVDTASVLAIIYVEPIMFDTDTSVVIGDGIELDAYAGPGFIYEWSPTDSLSCSDCPNPIASPLLSQVYEVNIYDPEGCFNIKSFYRVEVRRVTSIDVPTAFTPNGDGINDVIFVDGWGLESLVEFKVYNRYGQLVFESNDLNTGWDGFFEGKLQNAETYVYTARAISLLGGQELYKQGSFNLLR